MATPTGTVALRNNGNIVEETTLDGNGNYSFSYGQNLAPGTYSLDVAYLGDASHNPSSSTPVSQVVESPIQNTTTSQTDSPNPSVQGSNFTVSGTVSNA